MIKENEKVSISKQKAIEAAVEALYALGIPKEDAKDVADILVLADMMGISTHGIKRVISYGDRIAVGGINPQPNISIDQPSPTVARINGDNGIGPLLGQKALKRSMEMAKEYGVGITFVNGSNHFGPIMPYAYHAAEQGYMTFICSNATTTMAPTGGRTPKFGNNPLGFGVPSPDGNHILLDMALSVVARAKIRDAKDKGLDIPDTWATDVDGNPTTDPQAALEGMLQPVGAHKGYGLALIIDLLSGVLSNAAYLTHVKAWDKEPDQPQNLGHFFLVLDAKALGSTEWRLDRMQDFSNIIHSTPAIHESQPVMVPGERELKKLRQQQADGITYDKELFDSICNRAKTSN